MDNIEKIWWTLIGLTAMVVLFMALATGCGPATEPCCPEGVCAEKVGPDLLDPEQCPAIYNMTQCGLRKGHTGGHFWE